MHTAFKFVVLISILGLSISAVAKEGGRKSHSIDKDLSDIPHSQDGYHNTEYDHEAFLGREEARRFDDLTPEESKKRLSIIVDKIDTDKDGKVTPDELSVWIKQVSQKTLIDDAHRGWKEYGLPDGELLVLEKHFENIFGEDGEYEDEDETSRKNIMEREKRRWQVADEDGDGKLSEKEFFAFLHPDQDKKMRDVLVQETIEDLDTNKDGFIDVEEYINDLWSPNADESEPEWVKTERENFDEVRDKNRDGKLDATEIAQWIMPDDYDHVQAEVQHLFGESDTNDDGILTKEEILNQYSLFVGSQATNYGEILTEHDEL